MGGFARVCKSLKKRLDRRLEDPSDGNLTRCNCGWEIETGYAIAVGLATLEGKRLLLLAVGVFFDWNVLYFAGGLVPLVLTVVAAAVGVPAALAAVFTINKRRQKPCFPLIKRLIECLTGVILLCAILNTVVICSFAIYLNVRREKIGQVFSTSMFLYSNKPRDKISIDQLQFTFQCCGYAKYDDWIKFDWQKVDYASREEMSTQQKLSDEEFRPFAVPFSCCSLRAMTPCFHMDLSMDVASINENGCAAVLSAVVFRNAVLAYGVSAFLVLTQLLLALLMGKIAKRPSGPGCTSLCNSAAKSASVFPLMESSSSCVSSNGCTSRGDHRNAAAASPKKKRRCGHRLVPSGVYSEEESSSSSSPPAPSILKNSSGKMFASSAARTRCSGGGCGSGAAARIRPSLHTEHRVPKKRSPQKRGYVVDR